MTSWVSSWVVVTLLLICGTSCEVTEGHSTPHLKIPVAKANLDACVCWCAYPLTLVGSACACVRVCVCDILHLAENAGITWCEDDVGQSPRVCMKP